MRSLLPLLMVSACTYDRPARVDYCIDNNGGCDVNATCKMVDGEVDCRCNAGYDGNGLSCSVWARRVTISDTTLVPGTAEAAVAALGTKLYVGIEKDSLGESFLSIDVAPGTDAIQELPLPPANSTGTNDFCTCGYGEALVGLDSGVYAFGNDAAVYNTTTKAWTYLSAAAYPDSAKRGEAASAVALGRAFLMGGRAPYETSTEYFDGAGFVTPPAPLPFALPAGGAIAVGYTLYVFGGGPERRMTASRDARENHNQWRVLQDAPVDLGVSPTAAERDYTIVVSVGTSTLYRFSSITGEWTGTLDLPPGGDHWRLVYVDQKPFAIGQMGPDIVVYELLSIP